MLICLAVLAWIAALGLVMGLQVALERKGLVESARHHPETQDFVGAWKVRRAALEVERLAAIGALGRSSNRGGLVVAEVEPSGALSEAEAAGALSTRDSAGDLTRR